MASSSLISMQQAVFSLLLLTVISCSEEEINKTVPVLSKAELIHTLENITSSQHEETFKNETVRNQTNNLTLAPTLAPNTTSTTELLTTTPAPTQEQEEKHSSFTIFFILLVLAMCILVTHILISTKCHYLPESIAVVLVGGVIGAIVKLLSSHNLGDWHDEEAFPPTIFFLVILPPIIFESGYNLHKGNFFANLGTILIFAIIGTIISACVIGGGIFLLGLADVTYKLNIMESFAFGSLISAVDPVATLAIFHALDVEPVLYMLVFGESVLNDAVSIVLTSTVLGMGSPEMQAMSGVAKFFQGLGNFCLMFFASAAIGVAFAIVSAVTLKLVDLRRTPSLEVAFMLIFSYLPYGLAEGLGLSGIMAILFTGIVMSHYTHANLSPVTQITVQQTFRTVAFMAETVIFAYLGLAITGVYHHVQISFVIWSIVLCLVGRGLNIFPLSYIVNRFRSHKITPRMQFIMWFSGLRGAIAFALSLHIDIEEEKRQVLVTTTLIIVLFTIVLLGGSTMPLMKVLNRWRKKSKPAREITLSKTKEMGETIETDPHSASEFSEVEVRQLRPHVSKFMILDAKYFTPWLTRAMTPQAVREGKKQIANLTDQWYKEVSQRSTSAESDEELETTRVSQPLIANQGRNSGYNSD